MEGETIDLIKRIHDLFIFRKLTLSAAESCTGGLVSHYLTSQPGASLFFVGGVTAYSIGMKKEVLGITAETLERFGAVSDQTAREMAQRVRALCRSDWGLATTGNLGPDALEGKDRGLVYVAVSSSAGTVSRELQLTGSREENKHAASLSVLKLLLQAAEAALDLYEESPEH